MDIETARIFCDIVELQNFSRTAEKHRISQPAVSQQMAHLEMEHHCQLINRKKRPMRPSASGELLYQACKDIIERYNKLNSDLKTLAESPTRLNVAAIFSTGMHTLQPYVKKFMAKYPHINLHIDYLSAELIYDKLLQGDIDIGVVAVPKQNKNIEVYPFENEKLVFVCSKEHIFAKCSDLDIRLLKGEKFIAFEKNVPTRNAIDNIFRQYEVNVNNIMEFDNVETIKRAVEINSGVSILPEIVIHPELDANTLCAKSFSNAFFYRPTGVIIRKNKLLSQAGRYLIKLLQK